MVSWLVVCRLVCWLLVYVFECCVRVCCVLFVYWSVVVELAWWMCMRACSVGVCLSVSCLFLCCVIVVVACVVVVLTVCGLVSWLLVCLIDVFVWCCVCRLVGWLVVLCDRFVWLG